MMTDTLKIYRGLILFCFFLFTSFAGFAQTVCQPVAGVCPSPAGVTCTYAANIEKGCNCFDGLDNDGDGVNDSFDADCAYYYGLSITGTGGQCPSLNPPPGSNIFTGVSSKTASSQNTADTPSHISVGDMNGDGVPDVAVTSKWNSTVQIVSTTTTGSWKPGDVMSDFTSPGSDIFKNAGGDAGSNYVFEHETAIADIDGDKIGEVFVIASRRGGSPNNPPTEFWLCGFKYVSGKGNLKPLWTRSGKDVAVYLGTDRPGSIGLADFNGDGKAEVYLRNQIFAAETGYRLVNGGGTWDTQINAGPVAADMDKDGKLELVCGNFVYKVPTLSSRSATDGNGSLTVWKDMNVDFPATKFYPKGYNDVNEYGVDQASSTSVADVDLDGNIDVFMTGSINCSGNEASPCGTNITAVYYWNISKNTLQTYTPPDANYPALGWVWGTGRINLYDVITTPAGGDNKLEALFTSGTKLYCLGLDGTGTLGLKWSRSLNDALSGILSLTCYDFDNDGKPEVVYRDTKALVVCDGQTGATTKFSADCASHTFTEGPIIADVNGDGATDICVTCYTNFGVFDISNSTPQQQSLGQTQLYYTDSKTWLPTRKVWNQHPYYVTNILDNLTLPTTQVSQTLTFSGTCSNGITDPRPFNLFMDQVPYLVNGCPTFPSPNVGFLQEDGTVDLNLDGSKSTPSVEVVPPICGNLGIQVRFNIINNGNLGLTDNVAISFFNGDPRVGTSAVKLYSTTMNITNLGVDQTYQSPYYSFNGPGTIFDLYIVMYNNGATLPITSSDAIGTDCSIKTKIYKFTVGTTPFTVATEVVQNNLNCPPYAVGNNGQLRSRIYISGVEVVDYSPYAFQWYDASSVAISGATLYNLSNLDQGTYYVKVTNTQKGCSSTLIPGAITRSNPPFPNFTINKISDQTLCSPANGELVISPDDGSTGYTYTWLDLALNPIGVSGADAKNLLAGTYVVQIVKGTCTNPVRPQKAVGGPSYPDAQASTLQNVVDCLNPNSGSVTADAVINAVVQNPANYTFDWYFYNFATSTRGSILPAANGTGQTRTGLAAGYYQAVITDNVTKCIATTTPVTQVTTSTVIPSASISQVAPQTSCDANQPNGILTSAGVAAGYTSPTDFTFEWYRGDNTLAANKIPIAGGPETVSGAKGETLNNAKGGGIIYTVKIITPLNCSATNKLTLIEDVNKPVVTLSQSPNSICDAAKTNPVIAYNGSVTATVTFTQGGVTSAVTLPDPNYTFNWYDGTTTTTAHNPATSGGPTLSGLKDADYTATVTRTDLHCTSVPQTKTVLKTTIQPILSPTSTGSNNCDPALTPDGTVTAGLTNAQAGHNYTYQWYEGSTTVAPSVALTAAANNGTSATAIKVGGPYSPNKQYTVYVLDISSGCDNTTTQSVSDVSVIPVLTTSTIPNSMCSPASSYNGKMIANVTNIPAGYNISNYTFAWFDGNTTATPHAPVVTAATLTTLDVGTYSVKGTNTLTGCVSSLYTNNVISAKIFPVLQPASTGSNNCDAALTPDGTVSYSVTNTLADPGPFTQQWYTGSGDPIAAGLTILPVAPNNGNQITAIKVGGPNIPAGSAPHSYTVLVTNSITGCTNFTTASVPDVSVQPVIGTSTTPNSVCDTNLGFQGTMTATWTNPAGSYNFPADFTFAWSKNGVGIGSPVTTISGASITLTKLDVDSYSVIATNTKTGCISAASNNNVGNNKVFPVLTPAATGSNNCDNALTPDGTATVGAAGTPGPYTYQWYVGSGDPIAGAFPTVPTAINNGQSATAIKLGGPTGAPHSYTALVTDSGTGCTAYSTAIVQDISVAPILLTSPQPNDICSPSTSFAGSITVSLSVAQPVGTFPTDYVFTWYDGGTTATLHAPQPSPTSLATLSKLDAGTYSVTGKNTKTGCLSPLATDMVADQKIQPAIQLAAVGSHNCTNTVTPDGSATATITNNTHLPADDYNFVWTSVAPTVAVNASNNNITNFSTTATAINLGGPTNAPNSYKVTVTNNRTGCVNDNTAQVPDLSQKPTFTLTPNDNTVCTNVLAIPYNGHVDVSGIAHPLLAGSPITYTWYDVNSITSALILPANHTDLNFASVTDAWPNLGKGKYAATVTITSVDCTSDPVIVDVKDIPTLPTFSVTPTPSTNCVSGTDNGKVDVTVSNAGVNTFTFDWHKGNLVTDPAVVAPSVITSTTSTTSASVLQGGKNYTIQATNNQTGCKDSYTQTVVDGSILPTFTLTIVDNDKCIAPKDGKATVTGLTDPNALGGDTYTVAFTSTVSAPQTGVSLTYLNQPKSFASATVKNDRLGCTSAIVTEEIKDFLTYPTITTSVTNSTNCAGGTPNGSASVTAVIPVDTYEYRWYAGSSVGVAGTEINGAAPTGIAGISGKQGAADFTVEVNLTSTGCRDFKTITIQDASQLPLITPLDVTPNNNCTAPYDGTAFVNAATPFTYHGTTITSPYTGFTLTWSAGTVGPSDKITALAAGNYTLQVKAIAGNTVTNNNDNCISNLATAVIVDQLTPPVVSSTVLNKQTSCNPATPNGQIQAAETSGVGTYSFDWYLGVGPGLAGTELAETVDGTTTPVLVSDDYTVVVTNTTTRCLTTQTTFLPDFIVNPTLSFIGVGPVTSCTLPNGSATASITVSAPTNYDIYYVFTSQLSAASYPTDPAEIKPPAFDAANHTYTFLTNQNVVPVAYTGMAPGYLTAMVVDKNTSCESNPLTQQILDNTVKSNIAIAYHPVPGTCGGGMGGLDPTVTPLAAGAYTYKWYIGSPNNATAPINFFSNPPTFGTGQIYGDNGANLGINHAPPDNSINAGTYTLVVTDPDGCGTYKTDNVPTSSAPEFTITPTDITRCDIDNGVLDVSVTAGGSVLGYSIKIFLGNDATGTLEASLPASPINTPLTKNALPDGTYFIQVTDEDFPACPLGRSQVLVKNAVNPIVTLSILTPNTSCTPSAAADGSVQITVDKDPTDLTVVAPIYTITGITGTAAPSAVPATDIVTYPALYPYSVAQGVAKNLFSIPVNADPFTGGFGADTYTITVKETNSGCVIDNFITIPDQPQVPNLIDIDITNESFCSPNSSGNVTVTGVSPVAIVDYNYHWYTDAALTAQIYTAAGVAGATLNQADYAAWVNPTAGLGIGTRTYYVQGIRSAGLGIGCPTPAVQVVVQDIHATPQMTLSSLPNTSCDPLVGEGSITIATTTSSRTGAGTITSSMASTTVTGVGTSFLNELVVGSTITNSGGASLGTVASITSNTSFDLNANALLAVAGASYKISDPAVEIATYDYTLDPAGLNMTANNKAGTPATAWFTALLDNTYLIRASNTVSGCKVESNNTVSSSKFSLAITAFTSQDKLMCNPDGSINVTQITTDRTLTSQANVTYAPAAAPTLANNFDFRWFRATVPTGFADASALKDGAATVIPGEQLTDGAAAGQYPTMGSDLFYVIAKHKSGAGDLIGQGCATPPIQVNINDKHVNPTVALAPFSDTSCSGAAAFEGSIDVTISDASVTVPASTPYNYNYAWTTTSTTTPVVTNPYTNGVITFPDLENGDYQLTALNNMTGCSTVSNTTIIKNVTPVFVNNFIVNPQLICNNSGDIQITGITYKDRLGVLQAAPVADFSFVWTRTAVGVVGNAAALLNNVNYVGISADVYSVTATRIANSPGNGCTSAPVNIQIQDKSVNPVPAVTTLSNTSCNSTAPGEGEIKIIVTDATPAPNNGGTYAYTWNTLPATQVIANTGVNDGDGSGADADGDNPSLLLDGAYNLTIKNNLTGCQAVANATILKNAVPVFVQTVTVTDQILCSADGSLTVAKVSLNDRTGLSQDFVPPPPGAGQGTITDFDFDWTRAGVGPQSTTGLGGNILNAGNYSVVDLGNTGIGAGSYTVTAKRKTGSPGNGCKSAAFPVTIKDLRINPVITLTPFSNTSCNAAFEGEIKIKVTDATTYLPVPAGGYKFDYSWTASAGVTAPAASVSNNGNEVNDGAGPDKDFLIGQQDGTYNLTAINSTTQCSTLASTVITKNAAPVFVQNVSVVDQIICGPDGTLTITKVTLNDRTGASTTFDNTTVPALLTDFQFEWTRPGDAHIEIMNSGVAPAGAILNTGNYDAAFVSQPFGAGTYTVVARRKAGSPGANCASAPYSVVIQDKSIKPVVSLTPLANTSCDPAFFEGEIKVKVSDATANNVDHTFATPYAYSYVWGPVVTGIGASVNNDGDGFGGGENDGVAVDNDADHPKALQDGSYLVTVTNPQTLCQSTGSTTIFKNGTPVFTQSVLTTDQVLCTPDGKLVVNEVKIIDRAGVSQSNLNGDFPLTDFNFSYDRVIVGTTTSVLANSGNAFLDKTDYITPVTQPLPAGIGFGTYYVTTKRVLGAPGRDCSSAPYKVDILDKRLFPLPSLTPLANTSCDPAFFEGEIKVSVTDASVNIPAPLTGTPFTYNYTWPTAATGIGASLANDGDGFGGGENDGSGIDNDNDHPKGLMDGSYTVTVTNVVTGCSSNGSTTIFKNSTPVFTQLVVPTAQVLCSPDGNLIVKEVKIIDRNGVSQSNLNLPPDFPLSDFNFTYDRVIGGVTTNILTGSSNAFLDKTDYVTPVGQNPPGIGFGTYYVTTTRNIGFPGKGCSSAPYRVDIDDQRLYPKVAFTSIANSSCNVAKANGSVTAIASEQNGSQVDPYTFVWTLNGTPIASVLPTPPVQTDATPQSVITKALDGAYIATATNTVTGCPFAASFNLLLDQTRSTPNIIDVATVDPKDCNPSAGAEVTKITLGSTFNSSLQPPQIPPNNEVTGVALGPPRFVYTWYEGSLSNVLAPTLPCIGPLPNSCNTATTGLLSGVHFVRVVDTQTDCQSDPKQFDIKTDNIIYPVASITQTQKQISCIATVGTAILSGSAIEQDGTTGNYNFTWYPSLDLTGTAFTPPQAPSTTLNPNTLQNLVVGNYSIQVTNTVTSCTSAAIFIVPDDSPLFKPAISTGSSPQTYCTPPYDGDANVRVILDPAYPLLPYDNTAFVTDLYKGTAPILSNPPDVQANIPFVITGAPGAISYDVSQASNPLLTDGKYTFRVTDLNTGCYTIDSLEIKLQQTKPVIAITLDNPLTNCDPLIANGQLSATGDGKIQGYTFDWYAGGTVTGSILQTDNKLIGQLAGPYTVRTTNDLTGCFDDKTGLITTNQVTPPVPTAVVDHDQTSCIAPNGQVSATVGGVTVGYDFLWYNGSNTKPSPDYSFFFYPSVGAGDYTVVARDQVTHCENQKTVTVPDTHVQPMFTLLSSPSYCRDSGSPTGTLTLNQDPTVNVDFTEIAWSHADNPAIDTLTVIAIGPVILSPTPPSTTPDLFPGKYHVHVTSSDGCENHGDISIETEIRPYNLVSPTSPNANNIFTIDCISNYTRAAGAPEDNNVKIFNRSGTLVYDVDGYNNTSVFFHGLGEKGVYLSDRELPEGTYFYIIDKRNGTKPKAGYLELVR